MNVIMILVYRAKFLMFQITKYIFLAFVGFSVLGFASATGETGECKTCSGPSEEMLTYRQFLSDAIDSVTLTKPAVTQGSLVILGILKNLDSSAKNTQYNSRSQMKKSFRAKLYNGKQNVLGLKDLSKNLLSFGNVNKLKELQVMDKYSDTIDQLALKLIESKQWSSSISDSDLAKITNVLKKYSEGEKQIFISKISSQINGKSYSEFIKFLLNTNGKMQYFVLDGTLETINTYELSAKDDLSAAWYTGYVEDITKSYACSRGINKCSKSQSQLDDISRSFSNNMKNQKGEIQKSLNGLKAALSKFNSVVLGVQKKGYKTYNDFDETEKDMDLKYNDYEKYKQEMYGRTYQGGDDSQGFFGKRFQINKQVDSKLEDMISVGKDTANKTQNAQNTNQIKKQIVSQQADPTSVKPEYQIDINNRQPNFAANNLATAKSNMNNFITDSLVLQDKLMDKNLLSDSESVTKLFPNLSKIVYVNIGNIGERSQSDSCLTNFVDMCQYQCSNLGGSCEPARQ